MGPLFCVTPFVEWYILNSQPTLHDYSRSKSWVVSSELLAFWRALRPLRRREKFSRDTAINFGALLHLTAEQTQEHLNTLLAAELISIADAALSTLVLPTGVSQWVRSVPGVLLHEYLVNTSIWRRYGNRVFSKIITNDLLRTAIAVQEIDITSYSGDVAYHVSRPGLIAYSTGCTGNLKADGGVVWQLPDNNITRQWVCSDYLDIAGVVERSKNLFIAIQNETELTNFLEVVAAKSPRVVVEIGTARGGMLFALCQTAHPEALLVSIDLLGAPNCGGQSVREQQVFSTFRRSGQRVEFIQLDSHTEEAKRRLCRVLAGAKIDLLFIDGDHSYGGVKQDFEMYRELVSSDGIIVFHDICLFPQEWGIATGVGPFWTELSALYPVTEIVDPCGSSRRDKKPEEIRSWGIGILDCSRLSV